MDTPSTTLISYAPNSQRSPTSQRARAFTPTYRQHSQESRLLTDIIGITLWPIGFGRALRILSWLARSLTNLMNHRNIYKILGYFILKRRVDWFQSPFIPVINYICNYAFQLPYLLVLGGGWVKAYLAGFWLGVLGWRLPFQGSRLKVQGYAPMRHYLRAFDFDIEQVGWWNPPISTLDLPLLPQLWMMERAHILFSHP